jgi:predicted helicase
MLGFAPYAVRSFDRQWLVADNRLINRENKNLWESYSTRQVYLTALSQTSPKLGAATTVAANLPDHDHYNGRGGRVFPLWKDASATEPNVSPAAVKALAKAFGAPVDPVDVFAYVAGVLAHPAFTATHREDLIRPGLRVPLTADAALFRRAADLGSEVIWLHTFGERFNAGKPPGEPRLPEGEQPRHSAAHPIPTTPEEFPDTLDYDPATKQLKVGRGAIENVPQACGTTRSQARTC